MRKAGLAVAGLLLLTGGARAEPYRTYANYRFGTRVDVPQTWRAGREPQNGDGRRFTSPDGRASLTASAIFHTADSVDEEIEARLQPEPGEEITYRNRGPRAVTVSGVRGNRIFYRKSILACGDQIWHQLVIEYPTAEKAAYDAIVRQAASSIRQGTGLEAQNCPR